jgi:hypothetical protein
MSRAKTGTISRTIRYIPCQAEPGIFRNEFLCFLDALDPEHPDRTILVQVLVDSSEIKELQGKPERGRPVSALLRVGYAGSRRGLAHIILPQPAVPVGDSMIVKDEVLSG